MMNCQAVIFDLDGTLLDTLDDITGSANRVLAARGFPTHPQEAYRWFVGDGSAILITRALPEDQRNPDTVQDCLQSFIADYGRHWNKATRPYPGMLMLLKQLQDRNIKLSLVTNKPHRFTGSMMAHYFDAFHFSTILGQQDGIPKKPDPQQALAAAGQMNVAPAACVFLGDSAIDMATARNAGMQPIGAGWGFRTGEELRNAGALAVISHPLELLDLLDR